MEQMKTTLTEKLERILIHAASQPVGLEKKSLGELLYYALVEDHGMKGDGVLLQA
jgi:hypothetical protein